MNQKTVAIVVAIIIIGLTTFGISKNNRVKELKKIQKDYVSVAEDLKVTKNRYDSLAGAYQIITGQLEQKTAELAGISKELEEVFNMQAVSVSALKMRLQQMRKNIDTTSIDFDIPAPL